MRPTHCDVCKRPIGGQPYVDGATVMGPWGYMCYTSPTPEAHRADREPSCFEKFGVGLGTGRGQLYNEVGVKVRG